MQFHQQPNQQGSNVDQAHPDAASNPTIFKPSVILSQRHDRLLGVNFPPNQRMIIHKPANVLNRIDSAVFQTEE